MPNFKYEAISKGGDIVYGVVEAANKEDQILGNVIEIKHSDDIVSTYQSLSEINVKEGDAVKQNQIIGKSGNSNIQKEKRIRY